MQQNPENTFLSCTENRIPKVSIGLPVFNGDSYLCFAIESVLSQTFKDWELVIGDNCSTDNTSTIIDRYVARDSRIVSYRHSQNYGPVFNWDFVFQKAKRGKYFMWLSHDDVLLPRFLEKTVDILDENPNVVLACPLQRRIDENGETVSKNITERQHAGFLRLNLHSSRRFKLLRMWIAISSCGTTLIGGLIRREALDRIPPVCFDLGDVRKIIELSYIGAFGIYPEVLFLRREHAKSTGRVLAGISSYKGWPKYIKASCEDVGMSKFEVFCTLLIVLGARIKSYYRRILARLL